MEEKVDEKYDYREALKKLEVSLDEAPRVFFPSELLGIKAFNNSFETWLIRNLVNSGNGKISKTVHEYLRTVP